MPLRFAHVINPVDAPQGSALQKIQPVTIKSIQVAKDFCGTQTSVSLYAVGFENDYRNLPDCFINLPVLNRSVLDECLFEKKIKYPLLTDVLTSLFKGDSAEYLIFSNMDIALMPYFYLSIQSIIEEEQCDALVVNRRGVNARYNGVEDLPQMYAEYGKPHPGFDCFIFKRELLSKLILDKICIGVSFSEVALVHNLIAFADKLKLVDNLHLTFHIGTEVMPPLIAEYYNYNRKTYEQKIYPRLKPHLTLNKFPYSELSFPFRIVKWMLNPSFRTHQLLELEGKSAWRKFKYRLDTVRFYILDKLR